MRDYGWIIVASPVEMSWYNMLVYLLTAAFIYLQVNYPRWY